MLRAGLGVAGACLPPAFPPRGLAQRGEPTFRGNQWQSRSRNQRARRPIPHNPSCFRACHSKATSTTGPQNSVFKASWQLTAQGWWGGRQGGRYQVRSYGQEAPFCTPPPPTMASERPGWGAGGAPDSEQPPWLGCGVPTCTLAGGAGTDPTGPLCPGPCLQRRLAGAEGSRRPSALLCSLACRVAGHPSV